MGESTGRNTGQKRIIGKEKEIQSGNNDIREYKRPFPLMVLKKGKTGNTEAQQKDAEQRNAEKRSRTDNEPGITIEPPRAAWEMQEKVQTSPHPQQENMQTTDAEESAQSKRNSGNSTRRSGKRSLC